MRVKAISSFLAGCMSVLCGVMPFPILAQSNAPPRPPAKDAASVPVYRPPLLADALVTRIGGPSRSGGEGMLVLNVLAPETTGLTSHPRPTLYWYTSKPLTGRVEFTLNDDQSVHPLEERPLGAMAEGIHAVPVHQALKPGVEYEWSVSVVTNPSQRSADIVASGTIQFMPPPAALAARLKTTPPQRQPALYAQEGFWYDSIELLSKWIAAAPGQGVPREQRAGLLDQVGLKDAARYDRGGGR